MPISYNNDEEEDYPWNTDRGRVPAAFGGIMGLDGRRAYGLGSLNPFKAVKKVGKAIKKVAKSPLGKLALAYATYKFAPQMWGDKFGGQGGWRAGWEKFAPEFLKEGIFAKTPVSSEVEKKIALWKEFNPTKTVADIPKEVLKEWQTAAIANIGTTSAAGTAAAGKMGTLAQAALWGFPLLSMTPWGQELGKPKYNPNTMTMEEYEAQVAAWKQKNLAGLKDDAWKLPETLPTELQHAARGGRIGAQEGGLMNLGGMEKDYRQEGGFVPIGGQEKADDVPARLSKNEFVFTADAVRAAGGGDIDAGAEVMENVMENLEQGGQVSEESQGLEGARNMFATAQRLEGVM